MHTHNVGTHDDAHLGNELIRSVGSFELRATAHVRRDGTGLFAVRGRRRTRRRTRRIRSWGHRRPCVGSRVRHPYAATVGRGMCMDAGVITASVERALRTDSVHMYEWMCTYMCMYMADLYRYSAVVLAQSDLRGSEPPEAQSSVSRGDGKMANKNSEPWFVGSQLGTCGQEKVLSWQECKGT